MYFADKQPFIDKSRTLREWGQEVLKKRGNETDRK